jgi:hypothetical protein
VVFGGGNEDVKQGGNDLPGRVAGLAALGQDGVALEMDF